jgi:hypothetical protein
VRPSSSFTTEKTTPTERIRNGLILEPRMPPENFDREL